MLNNLNATQPCPYSGEMSLMIPANERATLMLTVSEADDLAAAGKILNGYRCLLGGMERATEAQEFDEPWAEELISRYREALDRYGSEHRVGLNSEHRASEWPRTVQEAVQRLIDTLPEEQKVAIGGMAEEDLIDLHFGLGLHIRNEFGLHAGNEVLRSDVTPSAFYADADEVSTAIIAALWQALRKSKSG